MNQVQFKSEVVGSIPEVLQANTLYVTTDGDVAGHLCACGCGREVVTPLTPTDWSITISRRGATLFPSIGNWAFPCRSHYFIWDGAIVWARDMSAEAIEQGRRRDKARKQDYYEKLNSQPKSKIEPPPPQYQSMIQRLRAWWSRLFG